MPRHFDVLSKVKLSKFSWRWVAKLQGDGWLSLGGWVAKSEIGRWVAKLVSRLLAIAAL
jgi:hypothetical protein